MDRWYLPEAETVTPIPDQDERTLAMLAPLLALFTGFIAPLVIYLVKRQESRFVAFHALQAMVWQIGFALVMVLGYIAMLATVFSLIPTGPTPAPSSAPPPAGFLVFFFGFWLLAMAGWVLNLVLMILFAVRAQRGEWAQYPLLGGWARRTVLGARPAGRIQ